MKTVSIGRLTSEFIFSGDPVVVSAVPNSFTEGSIFRQIVVDVQCDIMPISGNRSFQFVVAAIDNNKEVILDISSALRSTLSQWQYDASSVVDGARITYPYLQFYVTAHEREMTADGKVIDYSPTKEPSGEGVSFKSYLGRVGEYARWNGIKPDGRKFSSKPAGEVFASGQLMCLATLAESGVTTTVAAAGTNYSSERKVFLFVNSYGVFETISVLTNESMSYEVSSTRLALSQPPSYIAKPAVSTHKQGGGAVWQMSSGYVNCDWADWFASEFLTARQYWMWHDGKWLPVVVEPDGDTVTVVDRNDPSLLSVNFTVRSAVSGSIR